MKIKIITPNQYGRIEFSKEELEKILSEAYNEGYTDGKNYQINRGVYVDNLISCTTATPYIGSSGLTTIIDATATTTTAKSDLE